MSTNQHTSSFAPHRKIAVWLFICCFMVLSMAMIGAVTRLTESGLSITEWKPIAGALPPLNEEAWQAEFDLYKQTPEYDAKHFWMQLSDFKKIYFWEWLHRLWGRAIGIVFAVPLVWFAIRKQIPPGYGLKFIGLLALGGAQGFIGWFMVQSGLVDRPSVSHFRLSLHLFMAALVFALMLWLAIGLWRGTTHKNITAKHTVITGWVTLTMIAITIVWGAFVAGLDAGMIYNQFPHMGTGLVPPDFRTHPTMIGDIMQNPAAVQFTHRWLAIATLCVTALYIWMRTKGGAITGDVAALGVMILVQVGLGIATLLTQVDIHLATAHQAGAFILLGLLLNAQHRLMRG